MSLIITNSNDISLLRVQVTFDLSLNTDSNGNVQPMPNIKLQNLSVGNHLANISYAFIVQSPSQSFIHNGNISSPDISGIWSTTQLNDNWPMPSNNIEFAPVPYTFQVIAKDLAGNIFTCPIQLAPIVRPTGNTIASDDMSGDAVTIVKVQCDQASILFQDQTNYGYSGLQGTQISSLLTLGYPLDNTNTRPLPFIATNYAVCSAPITFSSDAYEFVQSTIYDYAFANDVLIRILYQQRQRFSVLCNIDLSPLVCEITKLQDDIYYGNCNNIAAAKDKLLQINSLFVQVVIGMWQPLSGVDVAGTIDKIKAIGGFVCNCYGVGSGLIAHKNAISNGINFILNPNGDITGSWSANGNNVTLNIADTTYILAINTANQDAYSWTPSTTGHQKTYTLNVNAAILAQDLVNVILATPSLINQLNFGNNFNITVDGKCIFTNGISNNYTITLSNVPTDSSFAILTAIQLDSSVVSLNYIFNNSNLSGLQTYLNGLGIGTFVVTGTSPHTTTVVITSANNGHTIIGLNYSIGSSNYSAQILKTSTGSMPLPAQQVIQSIINAICALHTGKVVLSAPYAVPSIDAAGNIVSTNLPITDKLDDYMGAVDASLLSLINFIRANPNVNCVSVKGVFATASPSIQSTDFFTGFFNGLCAKVTPIQLARMVIAVGRNDTQFMQDFCLAATICANSTSCPNILSFGYNVYGGYLNVTTVVFDSTPSSPQTVTVLYKLHSSGSYTTYSTSIVVDINGNVINAVSIPVTTGQTYDIQILGNCHSPKSGVTQTIIIANSSTSISVLTGNSSSTVCNSGTATTLYMNGAFAIGKVLYTDAALSTPLTGFLYIVYGGEVYNVSNTSGTILSDANVSCTTPPDPTTSVLTFDSYAAGVFGFSLSNAIPSTNTVISAADVNGAPTADCSTGYTESDTITSGNPITILGGSISGTGVGLSRMSCSIHSWIKAGGITVNGSPVNNGSVITIGGTSVTIVINHTCNTTYAC